MDVNSNIINSLGAGSGINSASIVEQLVDIERTSKQTPIDNKRELIEAQVSDYGLLRSALSLLQDSAGILGKESTFSSKSASFTDSAALIPSVLDDDAPVGDYTFDVQAIATAQSLSTNATFTDANEAVGKGVLTFSFGEWDAGDTPPFPDPPEVFTLDTSHDSFTVTIDDGNNSLAGLRDAINDADQGVQASIINDGSGSRLVITAQSGATNELKITVVEDGGTPTNTDASDLSRFAFDAGVGGANQQMLQNQSGQDASLIVNGLPVTRSSNSIDDVIDGFAFNLVKAAPGEIMTVTIFEDKSTSETAVRDFVSSFNAFLDAMQPLTGVDEETEELGSLARDSTTKGILTGLRNTIASAIPGLDTGFTSLAAIGIRTNLDGTISIHEDTFTKAFDDNFDLVQTLFAPEKSSSASGIVVNSYSAQTVPGSYAVAITQDPTKGQLIGAASTAVLLGAGATDHDFTIKLDGVTSGTISLTPGTYTNDELAAHIQSQINNDSALKAVSADVDVVWNIDHFEVTSRSYGSKSSLSVTAVGGSAANLGLDSGISTAGINVAGTFDGVVGFGIGNVLLPALNTDPSGLTLIVQPGTTTSTITFSGGFGREMSNLIDVFLQSNGTIDLREDNLSDRLEELKDDQIVVDRRIDAYEARLKAQYLAMERIVASLNTTGSFLTGILDRLPFTASNN